MAEPMALLCVSVVRGTAMIDRLMHHGEAIVIHGDSYRMKDKGKDFMRSTSTWMLATTRLTIDLYRFRQPYPPCGVPAMMVKVARQYVVGMCGHPLS
jgi:hypothetical protein